MTLKEKVDLAIVCQAALTMNAERCGEAKTAFGQGIDVTIKTGLETLRLAGGALKR
ncbi:hypothetical protein MGLY_25270 [Neomoorella glycerini]|uniref:Uncharacterized protein n=2 Tax=Neomoorella glycerini TaxID=55779 RepID=A0A6I5ZTY0_9FIRM|nr:hypothetical protein MGLY_25270 [Moorella glycerini]